jgi:uncharacterized membrane protein
MFVLTLIGFETLILLLPDIVSGGQRSTISRYLIPCYTGIQLAVAYFLTVKMTANYARRWQQQLWQIVAVVLVSLGILSCAISSQAPTWWNKYSSYYEPQVASIINQAVSPLVVVEDPIRLMGLSYLLSPNVKLQLVKELRNIQLSNGFNDIFLFRASEELQRELEQRQHYRIKPVYELGYLWRLEINH